MVAKKRNVSSLLLAALLSACGGGGSGGSSSPATLNLVADAVALDWNAELGIDVLANDTASRGALELIAVGSPSHGQARIEGGRLVYVPAPGYFGTDRVSYTARASDGGATASTTVDLVVSARLQLTGMVDAASLAGASVVVTVGPDEHVAGIDAQGHFRVNDVRSSRPDDVVTLMATGVGAQASVKLVSAAGDLQSLARHADGGGVVDPLRVPALNVSILSTALYAMLLEANGGVVPATATRIDELSSGILPRRVVDLATLLKLVADEGVALPAGAADTLALITNPASSTLLDAFSRSRTDATNGSQFNAAQVDLKREATPAGTPGLPMTGSRRVAYIDGGTPQGGDALLVDFRDDGTATVTRRRGSVGASWSIVNGVVELALTQPYSVPLEIELNLVTFEQEVVLRADTTGYRLSQVAGSAGVGLVFVEELGARVTLSGGVVVGTQAFDPASRLLLRSVDLASTPKMHASDFESGARWAGLVAGPFAVDPPLPAGNSSAATIAEFSGSSVTLARAAAALPWTVEDGWLRLADASFDRRYRRLSIDPVTGAETWLAADFSAGIVTHATEVLAAKLQTGLSFTNEPTFQRRWESPFGTAVTPLSIAIYADGSSDYLVAGEVAWSTPWSIESEGKLAMTLIIPPGSVRTREWTLLRRTGTQIVVLEHYIQTNAFDYWRTAVYTDRGTSGP